MTHTLQPWHVISLRHKAKTCHSLSFVLSVYLCLAPKAKRFKVSTATHTIEDVTSAEIGEQKKTHSQLHAQKNKKKWQVQTQLIEQQKKEIEKLKATQAPRVDTQQLVKAITQAMSCMYVGTKKLASDQETRGKPFLGTNRPSELSKGLDGSLDPNSSCWYCKDTSHEKENCRWLQKKLAHDCPATQEHKTMAKSNHH